MIEWSITYIVQSKIHTIDQPTIGAEVGGDGAHHWGTQALTREMVSRYRRAGERRQTAMLDEFRHAASCTPAPATTTRVGCCMWGKTVVERRDGERQRKVVRQHDALESVAAEGFEQTARYVGRYATEAGYLNRHRSAGDSGLRGEDLPHAAPLGAAEAPHP